MVFRLALSILLISAQSSLAQIAGSRVIFPGDPLPAEFTFKPLKLGTDYTLMERDWFLLKDQERALRQPIVGPFLNGNNAQVYFRLMTGLILKESMIRLGMIPSSARRFLESVAESGQDFAATPLDQMGPLPKGLAELYENWERPLYKMAVLPYLLLPLSVAFDQSQLQHFALAGLDDKAAGKSCSTISSVWPLGPVQSSLDEKSKTLFALESDLREAQARIQHSSFEQVRRTREIQDYSSEIDSSLGCFSSITSRVSRGGVMPSEECLNIAEAVFTKAKLTENWQRFKKHNLLNENGDFTDKQRAEEALKDREGRLNEALSRISAFKEAQAKQLQEQTDAREKIKKLNADLAAQRAEGERFSAEKKKLLEEQMTIQNLNHALETGTFEGSDAEKQTAVEGTAGRALRMAQIRTRLAAILQTEVKYQVSQTSIVRQIEFLTADIDQKQVSFESKQSQLRDPARGLELQLENLRADVKAANDVFLKASDEAKISEYVISVLNRRMSELSKSRDDLFDAIKKEEGMVQSYRAQIATAQRALDAQSGSLTKEVRSLEAMIASYKDINNMGWFLETNCDARLAFTKDQTGVYLARAKIAAPTGAATVSAADAGRWGIFNMDFHAFQADIQNGLLLNVPATVQLAVQQIFENYDYALTQQLDPSSSKCPEADRSNVANAMRIAASVWTLGNDASAKAKSLACRSANSDGTSAAYAATLARLANFEGSLLDQVLPLPNQGRPKDLIEREAMQNLGRELGPLLGIARKGPGADRDALIKSLLRILATDYAAEAAHQAASDAAHPYEFIFASEAPGGNFTGELQVGAEYSLNSLAAIPLFMEPINESRYLAGQSLGFRDRVKVLSPIKAGWVNVLYNNQSRWMAARPLTLSTLTDEAGREISGYPQLTSCASPRLVTWRARGSVLRFANHMRVSTGRRGVQRIDVARSPKVAPASSAKTYVACEKFSLNGSVAALRLVETRVIRARNGQTMYLPIEDVGGYVPVNKVVDDGPAVDPETWSLKK